MLKRNIKKEFSILKKNKSLVYLDMAATSLTPDIVIDAMSNYYKTYRSTINRGASTLSTRASEEYDASRQKIAKYFGVDFEEIIFTKSTTSSLNLLARTLEEKLDENSEIIVTNMEHHANFLPWLELSQRLNCKLKIIEAKNKKIDINDVLNAVTDSTKIVAIHHVSNIIGDTVDVETLCQKLNNINNKIFTVIDGAQAAPHLEVNISKINCDFYVLSAHKMYGPTGLGVLYIKKGIQKQLSPLEFGGDMVDPSTVDKDTYIPKSDYEKFEAGTPSIAEVIGFGYAIDFIKKYGINEIHNYEMELRNYAISKLKELGDQVILYNEEIEADIITFNIKNVSVHDAITDSMLSNVTFGAENISLRHGQHCNNLTMKYVLHSTAVLRISFGIYNTKKDIDKFINQVQKIYKVWN